MKTTVAGDKLKVKLALKPKWDERKAYVKQRGAFKPLLLTNANYFGNLLESPLDVVLPVSGNTFYEELACVGYHPQQEQLEGVVYVYHPSGYGTDLCGPGTPEYVRFYLSYDSGASWLDQGITSFQARNIPEGTEGAKFLEYAVSLKIDPKRKFCTANPVIDVRAILSWNSPPPPNQPNWVPVWGNVREAPIVVEPVRILFPRDIFEIAEVKFPPFLENVLDTAQPVQTKAKALSTAELAVQYKDADVPVHRFAFKEISKFVSAKSDVSAEAFSTLLPDLKIDPSIIDLLVPKTDGNTTYEELRCIGLDPNAPNTLVGVIQAKVPSGYSGGPCTDGSREYVTFWADFDGNGSFETCLGTADVQVYDLTNMPPDGVYYAVRLPVDLDEYRRRCRDGATVVRIRAILSWNLAPPCANPNYVPAWGNREETLINVQPVAGAPAGKIAILGGIPVSFIDDASGLTSPGAIFATNNMGVDANSPFGGRVTVQGSPLLGHSYRVEVTPSLGGAPTTVVTNLILTRQNGTTHLHTADPTTLRFDYLPFTQNVNSVLAQWNTAGDEQWIVKLFTYDGAGNQVGPPDVHLIRLDNTWPDAEITITSGTGDCGKFSIGTGLAGTFVARDDYIKRYTLSVIPNVNPPGIGVPSPSSGTLNTAVLPGDSWSLNTAGMRACGYVIRVWVTDRAIVNSQSVGHRKSDSSGFCLE
ncbi:MAG: hypothetical protein ACC655_05340 [Rhodothermia bacterium]